MRFSPTVYIKRREPNGGGNWASGAEYLINHPTNPLMLQPRFVRI